jgi:hypothetical protein
MDRRKLHHIWTDVRAVRPRYFFIAALLCLGVSLYALRANNLRMVELRDAVYAADKDNGDVSKALTELQRYVSRHMNTRLTGPNGVYPPIQLKYTYERLRAESAKASNEQVYTDAQRQCEAQNPTDFSGRNRVPCIQQYVEAHGVQQKPIPQSLYKFDFVSPAWSPDLAGFSVLATVLLALAGLAVWLVDKWFKRRLQ